MASCQKGTIARSSSISFYRTLVNYAEDQTNFILVSMMCDYVCSDHFRGGVGIQRSGLHRGSTYQQRYRIEMQNETLKFQYLVDNYRNCSLAELLTVLVE